MSCTSWFDCSDGKNNNLGLDQVIKLLIDVDENGCPVFRTSTSSGGGTSGAVTLPSTSRIPSRALVSVDGFVSAGSRSVTLETSSDFMGTILGVVAQASGFYTYAVNQNNDTIGEIAYTISSGSITINKIV